MRVAAALGVAGMTAAVGALFAWDVPVLAVLAVLAAAVAAAAHRWGRWRAVLWLGLVPWAGASLLADALWLSGAWDRSSEYEPLPLSMFVLPLLVPTLACAAAFGVALRRAAGRQPSA
jgi:hypothetical protein